MSKAQTSIAQIKEAFATAEVTQYGALFSLYEADEREGVKKILQQAKRRQEKYAEELSRIYQMQEYERKYEMYPVVCGIDEVGRGPLAGPVVAAAVVLPENCDILYINDSKKLSAAKRDELFEEIIAKAKAFGIGMASHTRIDEINILQATYEAMRQAILNLSANPSTSCKQKEMLPFVGESSGTAHLRPDVLLNDAVTIPGVDELFPTGEQKILQVPIIKGDAKSVSIAAASILAKVTRDRLMEQLSELYPAYGFAANKGYGSAEHIQALKKYGPCPIHRQSFIKNFIQ